MISVHFECNTVTELFAEMETILGRKQPGVVRDVTQITPQTETAPAPKRTYTKRTPESPTPPSEPATPIAAEASPSPQASLPTASEDAAASATLTLDMVRDKLKAVSQMNEGSGMTEATKIIKNAGYEKVATIQPEHFADIIAACDKRLAA